MRIWLSMMWVAATMFGLQARLPAAEPPTAMELLDRYAESQRILESFAIAYEVVSTIKGTMRGEERDNATYASVEIRYDGERAKLIRRTWGYVNSLIKDLPKEKSLYTSHLWDGQKYYQYGENAKPDRPARLFLDVSKNKRKMGANVQAIFRQDYIPHFVRGVPLDQLLRKATRISVRPTREQVGISQCYVIDAESNTMRHTIWLDPERGYNLIKADSTESGIDGKPQNVMRTTRDKVRCENIEGIWVPAEAELATDVRIDAELYVAAERYKATKFLHKPDHDALGHFLPSDVANGSVVQIVGIEGVFYRWRDGELVPVIDKNTIKNIDAEITRVKDLLDVKENGASTGGAAGAGQSVKGQAAAGAQPTTRPIALKPELAKFEALVRFYEMQKQLRSFIATGEDTIDTRYASAAPSRSKVASEIRTDGDRVSLRWRVWDEKFGAAKAQYKSALWDGTLWIEYHPAVNPMETELFVQKNDAMKRGRMAADYYGAPLMGICVGDNDPVDEVLMSVAISSVRERIEEINGSKCNVIEAVTPRGTYTLWIDPMHGYNLAKLEVQRNKGDLIYAGQRSTGGMAFALTNVRFEQVGQVWAPMEADMRSTASVASKTTTWHHKRLKVVLNPDFDSLRSFTPDDVPDGIAVRIGGEKPGDNKYKWQSGKVVAVTANK